MKDSLKRSTYRLDHKSLSKLHQRTSVFQNIGVYRSFSDNNENPEAPLPRETIPLEQDLEQLETQLREVNANQEQLNKNFLELTEVTFSYSNGKDCYALIKFSPGQYPA